MLKKNPKILVIDDEEDEVKLLKLILSPQGYEVDSAPDGKIGIEMVGSFKPDLIILDVMMPVLDGFSTCKQLKNSEYKDIPIILLTGVAEQIRKTSFPLDGVMRAEADEYIEKPAKPEDLLRTVKKFLHL